MLYLLAIALFFISLNFRKCYSSLAETLCATFCFSLFLHWLR